MIIVEVKDRRIKVTDDDRAQKAVIQKHKRKDFESLTRAEKDEMLLAALQMLGFAKKNGKIKSTEP